MSATAGQPLANGQLAAGSQSAGRDFRAGEVLIIVSSDGDDPEAVKRNGERCKFLRYAAVTGHCAVQLESGGRPMFFRARDLVRPLVPEGEIR